MSNIDSEGEVVDATGATAAILDARCQIRDLERELRNAHVKLHEALRVRKMVDALDAHEIPEAHRSRLIEEMTALGKGADFDAHVRDYRVAFIDTNSGSASRTEIK